MPSVPALRDVIRENKDGISGVVKAVQAKDAASITSALLVLVSSLAGRPEVALFKPLLDDGIKRLFVSRATRTLQAELAKMEAEEQASAARDDLAEALSSRLVDVLEGQLAESLLFPLAKLSHGISDDLRRLREEVARLSAQPGNETMQVALQRVEGGALGVELSGAALTTAKVHLRIEEQVVSGAGSVGIRLTR